MADIDSTKTPARIRLNLKNESYSEFKKEIHDTAWTPTREWEHFAEK